MTLTSESLQALIAGSDEFKARTQALADAQHRQDQKRADEFDPTKGALQLFREALRAARGGKTNLRDFAKATGVSRATLSRVERGYDVDIDVARRLGPKIGVCACCGREWQK